MRIADNSLLGAKVDAQVVDKFITRWQATQWGIRKELPDAGEKRGNTSRIERCGHILPRRYLFLNTRCG